MPDATELVAMVPAAERDRLEALDAIRMDAIRDLQAERDRLRALLALAEAHVSNGSSLRLQIREALSGVATTREPGGRSADGQ